MAEEFEQAWQRRYDNWAAKYQEDHLIAGWSAEGLARRLRLFLRVLPRAGLKPGSLTLDLGAGPGTYTRALGELGYRCIGLDFSRNVILAAKRKGSGEPYVQGDAYDLPFRSSVFSAVLCIGVLQSLGRPASVLSEIGRVLEPGGSLFLDGLNAGFWLRSAAALIGKRDEKVKSYDPRKLIVEIERSGFVDARIHWLAVPKWSQTIVRSTPAGKISRVSRAVGHSFLLHARKA